MLLHAEEIGSADDDRLADYTRLTDASLRTHLEAEHGLFIAEGSKVIARAVAAGYPVRSVLLAKSRLTDLSALNDAAAPATGSAPVYVLPDEAAEQLTGFRVHRGALAALGRKPLPPAADLLAAARRIVVLEDLVDHGNVGAIFRCAAALGVDAVLLSPRCADPLYRRSVKVSMGAVFAIPYARMTGWFDGLAGLRSAGFTVLALTPDDSAVPIDSALGQAAGDRVALLLGTEGDGLSARWLHEADQAVRIPMSPAARAAGVDSLNVVAAAAIACHSLMIAKLPHCADRSPSWARVSARTRKRLRRRGLAKVRHPALLEVLAGSGMTRMAAVAHQGPNRADPDRRRPAPAATLRYERSRSGCASSST